MSTFTRQQAESLLSSAEMELFNDSRINSLRQLSASELQQRIERTRELRDRARDLAQRQQLASQEETGHKRGTSGVANQRSKDKVPMMVDILRRFEGQLEVTAAREAEGAPPKGRKVASKKTAAKKKSPAASRRASQQDLQQFNQMSDPRAAKKLAGDTSRAKKSDTI